jgi:hypothetical protein
MQSVEITSHFKECRVRIEVREAEAKRGRILTDEEIQEIRLRF